MQRFHSPFFHLYGTNHDVLIVRHTFHHLHNIYRRCADLGAPHPTITTMLYDMEQPLWITHSNDWYKPHRRRTLFARNRRAIAGIYHVNRRHTQNRSHAPIYWWCGRTLFAPTVMRLHMNLHTVRRGRRTLHDILCNRLYSHMPCLRRVAHNCVAVIYL